MKKPLYNFSKNPMTGFYRDGYCRVGPEDSGNRKNFSFSYIALICTYSEVETCL
jgi:uncharacterized protein (DUF2237 family)